MNLNKEQFIEKYENKSYTYKYPEYKKQGVIFIKWMSGGQGGGSCWDTCDDSNHYPRESEPEPNFDSLDNLLEQYCPNLSFINYKKLANSLIHEDEYSENEYYGNYTDYRIKYVELSELYDFILKHE